MPDRRVRAFPGRVPATDLAARGALRVAGGVHARGREQEAPARGGGRRAARGVRAAAGHLLLQMLFRIFFYGISKCVI